VDEDKPGQKPSSFKSETALSDRQEKVCMPEKQGLVSTHLGLLPLVLVNKCWPIFALLKIVM
jgi:hypothetical protein